MRNTKEQNQLEKQAFELGKTASKNHKDCIPCLDKNLMQLLKGKQVNTKTIRLLSAWQRGFITNNLTKEVN